MPTRPRHAQSNVVALDYEIAQEQAAALGRAGRTLETALAHLFEHDRTAQADAQARAALVQAAADALWRFIIQRECCGLRDSRSVMRDYRVPKEVQNRMGAVVRPRGAR
jgi:hypothetical protein